MLARETDVELVRFKKLAWPSNTVASKWSGPAVVRPSKVASEWKNMKRKLPSARTSARSKWASALNQAPAKVQGPEKAVPLKSATAAKWVWLKSAFRPKPEFPPIAAR